MSAICLEQGHLRLYLKMEFKLTLFVQKKTDNFKEKMLTKTKNFTPFQR